MMDLSQEIDQDEYDEAFLYDETDLSASDQYVQKALPALVEHVMRQQDGVLTPLTYKEVARRIGRFNKNGVPWARGLGHILGRVTLMLEDLTAQWGETIPYLTTIVVAKHGVNKGLPGIGIRGKWVTYPDLTREEKEAKVFNEYQRILDFGSRWNEILEQLGYSKVTPTIPDDISGKSGGWGGGESAQHKALKKYVMEHPELVGADNTWEVHDEYSLRSGDEIDVFFRSHDHWIGVEVKSSISDGLKRDYQRGIYQVVKYRAVLEAQVLIDYPSSPPLISVYLVLESSLPAEYRQDAKKLGVNVMEGVLQVS